MSIVLDACSVINLHKVDALHVALALDREDFWIGPTAVGECGPTLVAELMSLSNLGLVHFVADEDIPTERVLELVAEHDIGDGEIEAIAVCEKTHRSLCSDDGLARKLASKLLGAERVVGGLGVLRWCVEDGALVCDDAFARYEAMKRLGAFLPSMAQEYFCSTGGAC